MKKIILLLSVVFFSNQLLAQCSLSGVVLDVEYGEMLPFANVLVSQHGVFVAGAMTGFEGEYCFEELAPGKYDVEVSYVGYPTQKIEGVVISDGRNTVQRIEMKTDVICCCCWVYIPHNPPLIEMDAFESGMTFRLDEKGRIRQ